MAVGIGMLLVQGANAGVIYSGPQDILITPLRPGTTASFQFVMDSTNTLGVVASYALGPPALAAIDAFQISANAEWVVGPGGDPAALAAGDLIGSSDTFSSGLDTLISEGNGFPTLGNFSATGGSAYLGFEFTVSGDIFYAYAHLATSVSDRPTASFVVEDWAYESAPGVGIAAGASEAPEPSPLLLVSLGVLCLVSMSRKRGLGRGEHAPRDASREIM